MSPGERRRSGALLAATVAAAVIAAPAAPVVAQCELQRLSTGNEVTDDFGRAVDVDGDVAVVGNPGGEDGVGFAYVYRHDGTGWVLEATLTSPVPEPFDQFGFSVAVDGDRVIVGIPAATGVGGQQGRAVVYAFDGGSWPQEAVLSASDGDGADLFGFRVDMHDGVAIVGARDDENGAATQSGSAYVFRRQIDDTWLEETRLTASAPATGDLFGAAVAIEGGVAVVGGPGIDVGGFVDAGAAIVFRHDGAAWQTEAVLESSTPAADALLGISVAVAGKTIVAGASDDSQLGFASGAAHVYRHDGAAWIEQAKLMASDGEGGDRFGRAVSVGASERIVLVGASNDDAPDAESGSAYVFRLSDDAWGEAGRLTASDGGPSAKFGIALCLSGEAALIGATRGGLPGAAYAFIGFGGDDCNDNGVSDACDIAGGASDDENRDGVPDECQVPGDLDGDGVVDVTDLQALILGWGMCEEPCPPSCPADLDGDCRVGISDLITLILNWG